MVGISKLALNNTVYDIEDKEARNSYRPNLLEFKWSDHILNDIQWLRADTFSWQDGNVYEAAYNHLMDDLGTFETYYCWAYDYGGGLTYYWSKSETPAVGDHLYYYDTSNNEMVDCYDGNNGDILSVAIDYSYIIPKDGDNWKYTRYPSLDKFVMTSGEVINFSTETVAGYTITYYEASDGHKIVLPNMAQTVLDIYNATGVAWYFILDTANERFKLPRINPAKKELLQTIGVRGNGKTLGLTNGTNDVGLSVNSNNAGNNHNLFQPSAFNIDVTTSGYGDSGPLGSYGVTTDSSKSGIIADLSSTTSIYAGQKHLYFYVGNYTQEAITQTAGITSEQLNAKVNLDASNLSSTGKSYISSLGMPSNEYVDLTWDANPNTKTAIANGWFWVNFITSTSSQFVTISVHDANDNVKFHNISWVPASNGGSMFVPVLKGDIVTFTAGPNQLASVSYFRFIYAEGEI